MIAEPLTTEEKATLLRFGVDIDAFPAADVEEVRTRNQRKAEAILGDSFTSSEVASQLNVTEQAVADLFEAQELYGFMWRGELRFPVFQFDENMNVLPFWGQVVPFISSSWDAFSVVRYFTVMNTDLRVLRVPVTPVVFLRETGDVPALLRNMELSFLTVSYLI